MKKTFLWCIIAVAAIGIALAGASVYYHNQKRAAIDRILNDIDKKIADFSGTGLEYDWVRQEGDRVIRRVSDFSRGPRLWSEHIDRRNISSAQIATDREGEQVYRLVEIRPCGGGENIHRIEVEVSVSKAMLKQVKKYDCQNRLVFYETSSNLRVKKTPPSGKTGKAD